MYARNITKQNLKKEEARVYVQSGVEYMHKQSVGL
jgi:hypothetical protein